MHRILVLTKNLLNEQKLQEDIQRLDHEVYCAHCDFDQMNQKIFLTKIFKLFSIIIISETVAANQRPQILEAIDTQQTTVFQKVERLPLEQERKQHERVGIDEWLAVTDPIEVLRDKIDQSPLSNFFTSIETLDERIEGTTTSEKLNRSFEVDKFLRGLDRLSRKETTVFYYLVSMGNKCVDRASICAHVWSDEITSSQLSSLSNTTKRIREKFRNAGIRDDIIVSYWNRGYTFTDTFWQLIQQTKIDNQLAK
ncbi:helix-turn-helix domain-containing protein [Enterococcus sp. AZ109]|uniref:helix-turn-helix domain-containing protein n=1 Tax=Enterococcus sp. AZ109 TaxID=2774634 RepID=UPI003F20232D